METNPIPSPSPWDEIDSAFDPMFSESLAIDHGGKKTTLRAAVFVSGTGDTLTDSTMETEREDITIVVRQDDWPFIQSLVRGDRITRPDGRRYNLSSVECDDLLGWCLIAREV